MTWINQIELDYPNDEFTLQEDLYGIAYLESRIQAIEAGNTIRTGGITKTGNARARKALVSAAWKYMYRPRVSVALAERQKKCSPAVLAISQRSQKRLHKRFHALNARKPPKVAAVAIARELVGFIWEAMQLPAQTQ